jgi:hypothetical protein
MLMRTLALAAALTLGACTTFSDIETGLDSYVGQPVQNVFSALGYPNGQQSIAGQNVYIWGNAFSMTMPQTNTSTTTGSVGGVPYQGTTTYNTYNTYNYECTIRVIASPNNIVQSWDYQGDIGGCSEYASRLNRARR